MKCQNCGGYVEWKGQLTNLTHTECAECGAVNNQVPEEGSDEPPAFSSSGWESMDTAPKDGTDIIGKYGDAECAIVWSDRPVCMLGSRCGGFSAGWATDGSETDNNLPMDQPDGWKHKESIEGGQE